VTAASSGTHTGAMGWQAARPCADTGAPDNGMWIPERGLGDTDGIPGDTGGISGAPAYEGLRCGINTATIRFFYRAVEPDSPIAVLSG